MLNSNNIVAFVPKRDSAKARSFYEGVLGLRFVKDDGFALVLDANGIMIRVAKAPDFKPAPFTVLGWQVSGIEKLVTALREKGVHFEIFGFLQQDKLAFGRLPEATRWLGSKTPTGMFCR
jgi:catechol 2,3-dioxygenase-like lactoylglutathione lyase family enzyme